MKSAALNRINVVWPKVTALLTITAREIWSAVVTTATHMIQDLQKAPTVAKGREVQAITVLKRNTVTKTVDAASQTKSVVCIKEPAERTVTVKMGSTVDTETLNPKLVGNTRSMFAPDTPMDHP